MSRKFNSKFKSIKTDVKYGSELLSRMINKIMQRGKKSLAEKIVYKALDTIKAKHTIDPLEVFNTAITNTKPFLELVSVRVGGANYQVPRPVDEHRQNTLSIVWIVAAAKNRSERTMIERLANEIFDAYSNRGGAIKKKDDTHKMAEANKAFAHFGVKKSKPKVA